MKIVIAPDSFKGSISAYDAAIAIEKGVKKYLPSAATVIVPMADGGEGTMDALVAATNGIIYHAQVKNPLGSDITAAYGVLGDGQTCIIETASASGLYLIPEDKRDPLKTTTYGMGQLIKQALDQGYRHFIIGLGGSATNDAGVGMLQALGLQFLDCNGHEIGFGGGALHNITRIDSRKFDKRIAEATFIIASDVKNPFIGSNGASAIFGPQKGATPEMVELLDNNLQHLADLIEKHTGIRIHDSEGAGAAGGLGGAFQAFFPAEIRAGIDIVINYSGFAKAVAGADLVITGEGQIDCQTAEGKTPMGVAQEAKKYNVPTIVLAGSIGEGIDVLYQYGIVSIHSIVNGPTTLQKAMEQASDLLTNCAEQVVRTFFAYKV